MPHRLLHAAYRFICVLSLCLLPASAIGNQFEEFKPPTGDSADAKITCELVPTIGSSDSLDFVVVADIPQGFSIAESEPNQPFRMRLKSIQGVEEQEAGFSANVQPTISSRDINESRTYSGKVTFRLPLKLQPGSSAGALSGSLSYMLTNEVRVLLKEHEFRVLYGKLPDKTAELASIPMGSEPLSIPIEETRPELAYELPLNKVASARSEPRGSLKSLFYISLFIIESLLWLSATSWVVWRVFLRLTGNKQQSIYIPAVIGGLIVTKCIENMMFYLIGLTALLRIELIAYTAIAIPAVTSLFGGVLIAALAPNIKTDHVNLAAVVLFILIGWPIMAFVLLQVIPYPNIIYQLPSYIVISVIGGSITTSCVLVIVMPLFMKLGGFIFCASLRRVQRTSIRRQWDYSTRDGKIIRVMDSWQYPGHAAFWLACSGIVIMTAWLPIVTQDAYLWMNWVPMLPVFGRLRRQAVSQSADSILADPNAKLVTLLRSFNDDGKKRRRGLFAEVLHAVYSLIGLTIEQELVRSLKSVGRPIAIGLPSEDLPQLGAARMYVSDDDWQDLITDLLNRDSVAVLCAGDTAGLRWEFQQVVRLSRPESAIIFFPACRDHEQKYQNFKTAMKDHFESLPPKLSNREIVFFSSDPPWHANVLDRQTRVPREHRLAKPLQRLSGRIGKFRLAVLIFLLLILVLIGIAAITEYAFH